MSKSYANIAKAKLTGSGSTDPTNSTNSTSQANQAASAGTNDTTSPSVTEESGSTKKASQTHTNPADVEEWFVPTRRLQGDGYMSVCRVHENTLFTGDQNSNSIVLTNLEDYKPKGIFNGHNGVIYDINISNDGNTAVSCSGGGEVCIWNTQTLELIKSFIIKNSTPKQVLINGNKLLVFGQALIKRYNNVFEIYDLDTITETNEPLKKIIWNKESPNKPIVIRWLNDTQFLIGCDDGNIIIKDYTDDEFHFENKIHEQKINSMVLSNDSSILLTSSMDQRIIETNITTWETIRTYEMPTQVDNVIFDKAEKKIYASGGADTSLVATSSNVDLKIYVFRRNKSKLVSHISSHFGPIKSMCFSTNTSSDNNILVSVGYDGIANIYDFDNCLTVNDPSSIEIEPGSLPIVLSPLVMVNVVASRLEREKKILSTAVNYVPGMNTVGVNYVKPPTKNEEWKPNTDNVEKVTNDIIHEKTSIWRPTFGAPAENRERREYNSGVAVKVSNINKCVGKAKIEEMFSSHSKIVFMKYNSNPEFPTDMAIIKYIDMENAQKAVDKWNKKGIEHLVITVEILEPRRY